MLYFIRTNLFFSLSSNNVLQFKENYLKGIESFASQIARNNTIKNLKIFKKIIKGDDIGLIYAKHVDFYKVEYKSNDSTLNLLFSKTIDRAEFSSKIKNRLKTNNHVILENEINFSEFLNKNDTIITEFQLRPELKIKILNIPKDLTKDEANRISNFFKTIYFNEI